MGNSIKFTSEGGAITVRAELADREVRFSVTDTGSGIAADEVPHIFERFWQARKTARLGAGLGSPSPRGSWRRMGGRSGRKAKLERAARSSSHCRWAIPRILCLAKTHPRIRVTTLIARIAR